MNGIVNWSRERNDIEELQMLSLEDQFLLALHRLYFCSVFNCSILSLDNMNVAC